MKKLLLFLLCSLSVEAVDMEITSEKRKAVPLLIGVIDKKTDEHMETIAQTLKRNFSFTKQFAVAIKHFDDIPSKKELQALSKQNVLLAIFLTPAHHGYDWRVYDTMSASMIIGKKYRKKGKEIRSWAYNMADAIWPTLTGQDGFFSTRIAYTKLLPTNKGRVKHIYVADYDGSNAEPLVNTSTINVAPRWNSDHKKPLVFYSDFTNTNVRLMVTDLDKKASVASDFDGVNMIPAFSRDGKKMVYCLSRGDGSCQLYYCKRGSFKRITDNQGNNVSPSLSEDGRIVYFCSDFETKQPQIYSYDLEKRTLDRITEGGYCASPRYNQKAQKLAYCKMMKGTLQLFIYDLTTKTH